MLAYVLVFIAVLSLAGLALTKGEEVQEKLSPRAKRRLASRGKPRYRKRNKKGKKIKG